MKWASHVAIALDLEEAIAQAAREVSVALGEQKPDITFVFISSRFQSEFASVPGLVAGYLPSKLVVGCSAGGVIGGGVECEGAEAVSITSALLPGVKCAPYYTDMEDAPNEDAAPQAWKEWLHMGDAEPQGFVILADPFSVAVEPLLSGLDYIFPQSVKIGGLASGATSPGGNAIFVNDQVYRSGVVAVAMHGNLVVDTVVAQGCKPIGEPLTVTKCSQNILEGVGGVSPLQYLKQLVPTLSDYDRALMETSLFLGMVMDPLKQEFRNGDYLVRNIVGMDSTTGNLAVGSLLHEGLVVQFHLRDSITSAEDLQSVLSVYRAEGNAEDASGALLFSCLGRGQYLYGQPHHDSSLFKQVVGQVPLGGFFCNGEIGPVGASTYVHGYTSSFGIFRPAISPPS